MAVAAINVLRDWIKQSNGASCACVRVRVRVRVCVLNGERDASQQEQEFRRGCRRAHGLQTPVRRDRRDTAWAYRAPPCALRVVCARGCGGAGVFLFFSEGRPVSCWLAAHTSGASMQRRQ